MFQNVPSEISLEVLEACLYKVRTTSCVICYNDYKNAHSYVDIHTIYIIHEINTAVRYQQLRLP